MGSDGPVLYPYQQRYLKDDSRFKVGMFSRQCGKTFTTTLESVLDCLEGESEGRPRRWTILSVSEDRAKDAIDNGVKLHLNAFQMAFEYLEEEFSKEDKAYEVRLPGGSRIRAIAANPRTARGMTENLILDEFAHHQDSRAIWTALFPVISKPGLKLRVISTPNGKGNKFYEIMTSDKMGFTRHITDIYQAVADGLPRNIEELKAGLNDPDAWAQEFECKFIDAATAWLTYDLIDSCEDPYAGIPDLYAGGYCYLGVDFGRERDLTTMYLLENVGDVLWLREYRELFRTPWHQQKEVINELFRKYRILRAAMDSTGMGSEPVEWAKYQHGHSRVEAVNFSGERKLNIATVLKTRMEDRLIRIPHVQALRDDLHSVTKTIGPTGSPRLSAGRANGSHADRFWALALACAAADTEAPPDYSQIQTTGQTEKDLPLRTWGSISGVNYCGY
ncbi:terminase [bacterium (Candidatus Blackallbacteria) CG13_big_fil_rev_8_21_14_2_50_49_14]|nr:MAG: terminase [bacterium (Candidatus Blackallbacteria) CG18_big_fil_WC_8_21_14_2_50_49_26]PIW46632.1 MAG: terminase [bacterium (Candidatus Blackallbacteria) CG13_big_fil_rev_8_21_14_2_50_49_14]